MTAAEERPQRRDDPREATLIYPAPSTPVTDAGPPLHMRRDGFGPVPALAGIRQDVGVCTALDHTGKRIHLVTRYDDIKTVLSDHVRFSSALSPGYATADTPRHGNLLALDPPMHNKMRSMLAPAFTAQRTKRLEGRVVQIVGEHLDTLECRGAPAELMSSYALPIPTLVICELLGVPDSDRQEFQRRTSRVLDLSVPMTERIEMRRQSQEYMRSLVVAARRAPREDMLGMLVRDHGDVLTDAELAGMATLVLEAGHETTASMLALGVLVLLRNPDQFASVRDHDEHVLPAVEELLRFLSVAHTAFPRVTTTDVEIGGVVIPAGESVITCLPTGNRDDRLTDAPDTLNINRSAAGHLAFGHGVHHCLGAPLARMEMRIALPALLRRFPRLALVGRFDEVRFRSFNLVYGVAEMHVTW
jgi:cytochrome P450